MLPANEHRWKCSALTLVKQVDTLFTYPREGGRSWPGWLVVHVYWNFLPVRRQSVTHQGSNSLIATQPGVKPTTSSPRVQCPNAYATKPPLLTLIYKNPLRITPQQRDINDADSWYATYTPWMNHKLWLYSLSKQTLGSGVAGPLATQGGGQICCPFVLGFWNWRACLKHKSHVMPTVTLVS